jgi:hypothetical protein
MPARTRVAFAEVVVKTRGKIYVGMVCVGLGVLVGVCFGVEGKAERLPLSQELWRTHVPGGTTHRAPSGSLLFDSLAAVEIDAGLEDLPCAAAGRFDSDLAIGGMACGSKDAPRSGLGAGQESSAGSVAGRVVLEGIGAGVRKAVVLLERVNAEGASTAAGIEGRQEYVTATDVEGRFRIEGVAAGEYSVNWTRAGFVRAMTKPEAMKITVAAGQELIGLVFKMQMTGVIAGKITEAEGDALQGVSVWVTRVGKDGTEFDEKGRDTGDAGQETTNDLGEFRIAGLRAGQYIVQAQAHGLNPAPDPADRGRQRDRATYALTYYPGTADTKTATPVQVTAGGIATANFEVVTSRSFRVSGTVTVTGNPGNVQMYLVSTTGQTEAQGLGEGGKFEFATVLPGTYVAQIVDMRFSGEGNPPETHSQMIGSPIVVSNADVTGLVLQPEAAGSMSGKVRTEDGAALDWRDLNVTLVRVTQAQELPQMAGIGALGGNTGIKEDGSFEIKDVAGATYWVFIGGHSDAFRDYYLKSVLVDGRETVDTGIVVTGETVVEVVVSAKGASIEGTVVDGNGRGVVGAAVVTLPSTGKVGRMDLYLTEKTDASGHFLMRGMNPGAYVVVAMDSLPEDARTAEFFQKYGDKGTNVDLGEGERKSVEVKMVEEK